MKFNLNRIHYSFCTPLKAIMTTVLKQENDSPKNWRLDTRSQSLSSSISGGLSPKLISPRDKKLKHFHFTAAMGNELERVKQTYASVQKPTDPPPEERKVVKVSRSNSTVLNRAAPNVNSKFRSLGGKVTNLLRVRKAFATTKKDEDDIITSNKHLPKEPRFSSSMSPAAQFAFMKGYEDTIYENLCKNYPSSKLFLKRSKTPPRATIDINDVSKLLQATIPEDNQDDIEKSETNEETNLKKYAETRQAHREKRIRICSLNSEPGPDPSRRLSERRSTLVRTKSMPVVVRHVPHEKRLILSHRLQSAMDILDTVRGNLGQNPLSPRINRYPRQIQPVSDFNQWSSIWSNEFKINRKPYGKV